MGDQVVTRLNTHGRSKVANGDRWEVVAAEASGALSVRGVSAKGVHGPVRHLKAEYAAKHVHHAYAVTVNISQGSTVHTAHVLASEASYREALYVGASRATDRTRFYVAPSEEVEVCADSTSGVHRVSAMGGHLSPAATDVPGVDAAAVALEELSRWAGVSRAKDMAVESLDALPDDVCPVG